jgi:hypothetical protein
MWSQYKIIKGEQMIYQERLKGCTKDMLEVMDIIETEAKRKGTDVIVSCGYRSPEDNAKIPNASKTSLHLSGNAVDFYFSDKYNIFKHVTWIYEMCLTSSAFNKVTEMEVCRGVIDGQWVNHIHLGIGGHPDVRFFTGVYK